jgi:tetratricopeptide (TPR) repeat protein
MLPLGMAAQDGLKTIKGTLTDGKNPIENVKVHIDAKSTVTTSDTQGKYSLEAETGDVITYTYMGMKTINIRVEDVTRILNPIMIPDVNELDEVVVQASKRRSQNDMKEDYAVNKNIIRTAWGYLDADRAAGNVRILTEDEINPISICILDLLRNRFPGVRVTGSCTTGGTTPDIGDVTDQRLQIGGQVQIRPGNSLISALPAVFDIDGQIFEDAPVWLDVNRIKRIAILSNLATTAPYGAFGKGGVVVINTIGGNPTANQFVDRARLKNNFADGTELNREEVAKNAPAYLKDLMNSDSFENAKSIFEKHRTTYFNSPYFLLDAYSYFSETRKEMEYADGIIEAYFGPYTTNPVLLKALAYTYESQQRYEKANDVYKEVFILRPNYVQSYFDMANSYRNLDEPKQAASLYARYEYLINEGFLEKDTLGFGLIMEREFNNLLMLHRNKLVDSRKANKLFVAKEDFEGTRLVFEWNDGEAEFDLQFVNPENQYLKWKHNLSDNSAVVAREKDFGYNVKEYLVDGALPGTWKVNVNYLGNKSLTPSYLKATIYSNYGTPLQRKEVKTFKLSLKNVNQQLFTLQVASKVVSR